MAGFDIIDPAKTLDFGYRSAHLRSGVVSYNGFQFPPALKSRVDIVPEYNEAQTSLKYLTIAFQIEFILTDYLLAPEDVGTTTAITVTHWSAIMLDLRKRLSQPGQPLVFTTQGFGEYAVNFPGGIQDVDYGPKPQVISWEPLGGHNAVRIEWLCTTRVPPCGNIIGPMIQCNYSVDWAIDPSGFMLITREGSAEFPKKRTQNAAGDEASGILPDLAGDVYLLKKHVYTIFPYMPGFRRQVFFRVSKDRKKIDFKFEDLENRTDNSFFPGVSDMDISQNASSSIEDGFTTWRIVYTGRVEVLKGTKSQGSINKSKAFAWIYIGKLLQQKRKEFSTTIQSRFTSLTTEERDQLKDFYSKDLFDLMTGDSYSQYTFIYPIYFSLTDDLYSNTFNFTVGYQGIMVSSLLAEGVGLFQPLLIDGVDNTTVVKYIKQYGSHDGEIDISNTFRAEPVIDLCHPLISHAPELLPGREERTEQDSRKIGEGITTVNEVDEERSWIDYKNDITFYDETGTVIAKSLHNEDEGRISTTDRVDLTDGKSKILDTRQGGEINLFSPGALIGAASALPQPHVQAYKPSQSIVYVRMTGYGERFGNKVNPPRLLGIGPGLTYNKSTGEAEINTDTKNGKGVGGALAIQKGQKKVKYSKKKTGLLNNKGKVVYKSRTDWDIMYVLDRRLPADIDGAKVWTTQPQNILNR